MNILDEILSSHNGGAVEQIAARTGLGVGEAQSAIGALLPGLLGAVRGQASQGGGGLEGLLGMLTSGVGQPYLDNPANLGGDSAIGDGNNVLAQILGSKEASRALANQASAQTGIGADVLKQILPMVASLAMGAMGRQTQQANLASSGGGLEGLLGMLTPMLDANRDGSAVDDVLGMAAKMFQK